MIRPAPTLACDAALSAILAAPMLAARDELAVLKSMRKAPTLA